MSAASPVCGITRFAERDVDLFLAEELAVNPAMSRWLLARAGLAEAVHHPAVTTNVSVHADGSEADVLADFERVDGGIHRVFVEDKLDAILMPEQLERYVRRGEGDVRMDRCASVSVFLFAPDAYGAALPPGVLRVTFEELARALPELIPGPRGAWRASFLLTARPRGSAARRDSHVLETDPFIAEWWDAVYAQLESRHPGYFTHRTRYPRSTYFAPSGPDQPASLRVDLKGHKGEVDLAFRSIPAPLLAGVVERLPPAPGPVVANTQSSAIRVSGLAPVVISDGFDAIEGPMMALYDAARDLLDYWRTHRPAFDGLRAATQ